MAKRKQNTGRSPEVAVVMGSDSDWSLLEETVNTLTRFGVASEVRVMSAHRTPDLAAGYARKASDRGFKVIIAAAGGAAHLESKLSRMLRSKNTRPVASGPIASTRASNLPISRLTQSSQ